MHTRFRGIVRKAFKLNFGNTQHNHLSIGITHLFNEIVIVKIIQK